MTVSRRMLLTTLGLMLPAVAAEAAKPHKPAAHKPHHVAKATPHGKPAHLAKAAAPHKVARRHHSAGKPPVKQG